MILYLCECMRRKVIKVPQSPDRVIVWWCGSHCVCRCHGTWAPR